MSEKNISSHVLDTSTGIPAYGINISLYISPGSQDSANEDGEKQWILVGERTTNSDGRAKFIFAEFENPHISEEVMTYKMIFWTENYFQRTGTPTFYPKVEIYFRIVDPAIHHHIPLIISPYGYSTYKGS
mmetsp:Transcript_8150/g.11453  ORF Transcript_8150/g.11453 Transcript_8150/m.11453 type:complete len:130 (+) Transcript_8150:66-455(+)